ncbi:inhibitor of growth proteins N-terminal histone-binding-domain-containing protein [Lobosporangium transversale]|uniref:Chromatin modification-related protein n=1 Tax=Lobosporangium transversale TaxID=64571 RepID=A0A1Y2GHQ4_9FUNG|nr:inhibitor of growth proteins N-terminal histone-binding-domain-containing protein [Lobosporangium transversale]ORZ11339.1 inhibitor of growth proteins N-terminal histone-binding-domain-containing protein [Lobosporangium transversale]|eukprot:XP_021879654.1 inhibitor of growth proteins N-terminal histone-binding-domain-containing protein [Lobosporangium transversale]
MKASSASTGTRTEALAYLDDYLDTVESLPLELQRQFTLMQDLDAKAQSIMAQVSAKAAEFIDNVQACTPQERIQLLKSLNEMLVESLRQGEEKVALATAAYDVVDRHVRRLDDDLQKYEDEQMIGPGRLGNTNSITAGASTADRKDESASAVVASTATSNKKGGSSAAQDTPPSKRKKQAHNTNNSNNNAATPAPTTSEKRKGGAVTTSSGSKGAKKTTSFTSELPIDPNEPLYCYCQQVSYGEMVACDNGDCEIEWFHLSCAGLKAPPKGKWYCKDCSQKSKKPQKK